jgi:hypothetical protein
MKRLIFVFFVLVGGFWIISKAEAHEMVPTYPKWEPSYIGDNLVKTTMTMFNKREEIEYYEIGVFDDNWETIPFVSQYQVLKIPYLSTVTFDVYIRKDDKYRARYVCSRSKIRKEDLTRTAVSSRICSKFK